MLFSGDCAAVVDLDLVGEAELILSHVYQNGSL